MQHVVMQPIPPAVSTFAVVHRSAFRDLMLRRISSKMRKGQSGDLAPRLAGLAAPHAAAPMQRLQNSQARCPCRAIG